MSSMTRTNRLMDPFALAQRELDTVFGHLMGNGGEIAYRPYPVDVRETVDGFVVEAELPGFTKEQVEITLENNVLTLSAERSETRNESTEAQPEANAEGQGQNGQAATVTNGATSRFTGDRFCLRRPTVRR